MKIVFLITTVGHGKGGHFHSLNTMATELAKENEVTVFNLGVAKSEVLNEKKYNVKFYDFNGKNTFSLLKKLKRDTQIIQPNVIHAFDLESFAFARTLSATMKIPNYLTKCGGPNPGKYYPKVNNLVLFSRENLAYFDSNKRFRNVSKFLIPNRVKKVLVDTQEVEEFNKEHSFKSKRILRICRIGKHYHNSINQGLNLCAYLINKGVSTQFILIGTIQSQEVYNAILQKIDDLGIQKYVVIKTGERYTREASRLLTIGDLVLGTGRNFMEASSLNLPLLVPYSSSDFPLLVNNEIFERVFSTNFSPRTHIQNFNEDQNLESITKWFKGELEINSKQWFEDYFDVKKGAEKYMEMYKTNEVNKRRLYLDEFLNHLYSIKTFRLK